jgi:hypothetical protein
METHPRGDRPNGSSEHHLDRPDDARRQGGEVPVLVNGMSSGQTMKIRKIDSHHTVAIMLFQGKEKSVSKAEISPDGKVLTIETDYTTSNPIGRAGTQIEYWNRQ